MHTALLRSTPCCPRHLKAHQLQDQLLRVSRAQGGSGQALTPAQAPGSCQQSRVLTPGSGPLCLTDM